MMKSASLQRRIRRLKQGTLLHRAEATILEDLLILEDTQPFWLRPLPLLDFIERYLPKTLPKPRGPRGRLIGEDRELNALRSRIRSDSVSAALWKNLLVACRRLVAPGSPDRIDWRTRTSDLWRQRTGCFHLSRDMQQLAWAGRLGRIPQYEEAARQILMAIVRTRHGWGPLGCNYGHPYRGWLNDNLLDIGHATLGPAIVFSLLRDRFSKAEAAEVVAYFEPYLYRALTERHYGLNQPGNNFAPIGFSGVGILAMALWQDVPAARRSVLREVIAWAEAYARFTLETVGGRDGAAVEGSAYGSASLYYVALFAEGLRRCCGKNLFMHPGWGRFARYLITETLPGGGAFNNFNDNDCEDGIVAFWPLVARHSGDAVGDWVWCHHVGPGRPGGLIIRPGAYCEQPYVLLFREPRHDALTSDRLGVQPVRWFRDQHHWVARTGWDQKDLHVSFQCTRGRPGGHSQEDRLNFTLYALGERMAVDSGYGVVKIPGSTGVQRLGALSESHNIVLMDGRGQNSTIAPDAGWIRTVGRETGGWVWALGDAIGAYEGMKLVRRCVAVRLTRDHPAVVVADCIVPKTPGRHRFDWLLHTATGNRVSRLAAGGVVIKGGRSGNSMSVCHATAERVRQEQDTWIEHPRVRFISVGEYLIALTLFVATDKVWRVVGRNNMSVRWMDDAGSLAASVDWSSDANPPSHQGKDIPGKGEGDFSLKARPRSVRLHIADFTVKLV